MSASWNGACIVALKGADYMDDSNSTERGFTLVELMIVLTLVGILATVGVLVLRRWVVSSKSVEAFQMVQSIRAAEERHRAENMVYLDVSPNLTAWYPMAVPGTKKYNWVNTSHSDYANWRRLNPTITGPVQHGYAVKAGRAGSAPIAPTAVTVTWPAAADVMEPWYVIQARGDLDGDGTFAHYVAASFTGEIVRVNEGD